MTGKTHIATGLLTGTLIVNNGWIAGNGYVIMTSVILGAMIPDTDTEKSLISQMFPPVSLICRMFTKHRGFTHTLLPLLMFLAFWNWRYVALLGITIGLCVHVGFDFLNRRLNITCGSPREHFVFYASYFFICIVVWKHIENIVNKATEYVCLFTK
jgi:membrane-bound metal-dependent hydrolase YbcI (DUF457 family)